MCWLRSNLLVSSAATKTRLLSNRLFVLDSGKRFVIASTVRVALSGGQQQRLCIARSLAVHPNVLLMDEPCSALDPTSTRRVEETIDELRGEVTVVIVTHNMQQAQRVSDLCAFFLAAENQPGVVVEQGPTDVMFSTPTDSRTLDYVQGRFG